MKYLLDTPANIFSYANFSEAYTALQSFLPFVKHHFALKSLPLASCIKQLGVMEGYIDVASTGEMDLVKHTCPSMLQRAIYTHPIKSDRDIRGSLDMGIEVVVVDNIYELEKLLPYINRVKVLIRIAFPNSEAKINLSEKFGVSFNHAPDLIEKAIQYKFTVIGCCFHVGSGLEKPAMHVEAIKKCAVLYQWVSMKFNITLPILDIGGGFPPYSRQQHQGLKLFFEPIQKVLNEFFPETEIWSEPGRFLSSPSMCSLSSVVGKKIKDGTYYYYLNDGVYGSFSGKIFDCAQYEIEPLFELNVQKFPTTFLGPTCDSLDVIHTGVQCRELEIGEIVLARNIGAYSRATATQFNMLQQPILIETHDDMDAYLDDVCNRYHVCNLRYA